jgi:hypothetical protein
VKRFGVVVAAVVVLAGCGGGEPHYTLAKTRDCLVGQNVHVGRPVDFVATTATGGATRAFPPGNRVTIVFGETDSDADNIALEYRRVAAANVGIDDVLRQQGNAVMLWHIHPTDAQQNTITGCLK